MVEIVIIATVLELLFNYQQYTEDMRMILLGLGVSFLAIYAFKYEMFVKAVTDSEKRMVIPKRTPKPKVVKKTRAKNE